MKAHDLPLHMCKVAYTISYIYMYIDRYIKKNRERELKSKAAIENLESIDPERKKRARKNTSRVLCSPK